jgi:glycosyltransferase involved in cell wall biosynthesis
MLRACLESLIRQRVPEDVLLSIVVVENDEASACKRIVEELAAVADAPPIAYAHEPRLGIPIARNRALELALAQDPDWIAFIDDDEVAPVDWVARFAAASRMLEADVLHGPVEAHADASGETVVPRKRRPSGERLKTAATNNTLMRARLVREGAGELSLRFNEAMRFSGGSDNDFFSRAVALGAVIRWVDDNIVRETVPASRQTFRWMLERNRRTGGTYVMMRLRNRGVLHTITHLPLRIIGKLAGAGGMALAGAVFCLFDPAMGRNKMRKAMGSAFWCVGALSTLAGWRPQVYATVDGY